MNSRGLEVIETLKIILCEKGYKEKIKTISRICPHKDILYPGEDDVHHNCLVWNKDTSDSWLQQNVGVIFSLRQKLSLKRNIITFCGFASSFQLKKNRAHLMSDQFLSNFPCYLNADVAKQLNARNHFLEHVTFFYM